jgi:membrane-associated phospholipid phosphatase
LKKREIEMKLNKSVFGLFFVILMVLFTSGIVLVTYASSPVTNQHYCINENDSSILNRCFREYPLGLLTIFSNTLLQWVNPRMLAITTVCVYLLLPIILFSHVRLRDIKASHLKRFHQLKVLTLNFLHRICYTLVLDVALYALFRQSRPCRCTDDGGKTFAHVGSIYGMPSGDAMSGALFGMLVYDYAPFHPILGRIFGLLIIPLVSLERVVLGYHSIAQVTVGSLLGVVLHVWNTRMPQWTIFFDAIVQFTLGLILLNIDPALVFTYNDTNNLFAWFIWGVGFQVFVCWCIAPIFFFKRGDWRKLLWNLQNTEGNFLYRGEAQEIYDGFISQKTITPTDLLDEDREEVVRINSQELRYFGCVTWTLIGLSILLALNFLSSWITQEAILVKIK